MSERSQGVMWRVSAGDDETSALYEAAPQAHHVLVLGHGASTHREHAGMARLAATFLTRGISVVRFNFLYTEKKKGPPDRMPRLMECFAAVVEHARRELPHHRLVIGGHSMGGRTASMLAAAGFECDGLLLLAYPLHPAGQPEKLRDAHLANVRVPVLGLNGTRDELCQKELMERVLVELSGSFTMHWLEGADHGFHVQKRSGRTEEDVMAEIGATTRDWLDQTAVGRLKGK